MQIKGALTGAGITLALLVGGGTAAAIANAQSGEQRPHAPAPTESVSGTPSPTPIATQESGVTDAPTDTPIPETQPATAPQAEPGVRPAARASEPETATEPAPVEVLPTPEPAPPSGDPNAELPPGWIIVNGVPTDPNGDPVPAAGGYSDEHGNWIPLP